MENIEKNETDVWKLGENNKYMGNQVNDKMSQLDIYQIHVFG